MCPLPSLLTFSLLLCFITRTAFAIPAPMSDVELLEKSDLVALVRVLSVTCTGLWKDGRTGEDLRSFSAKLKVIEVKKGNQHSGDVLTVMFQDIPQGMLGPWTVFYYPGEEVRSHFVGGNGSYETTWWNARKQQVHGAIAELPDKPGETVAIPEGRQ